MVVKECLRCQQSFEAQKRFARYCVPCRTAILYEQRREHRREHPPTFRAEGFHCAICEKAFEPLTRREKYCGDECYQEARRRQAKTPEQRARGARKTQRRRDKDPEHMRQLVRESRVRCLDQRLEDTREWYRRHPGYRAKASRKWRAKHSTQKCQESAAYYRTNKEKVATRVRAYALGHRWVYQAASIRRRALKAKAGGDFTGQQFLELCVACGWRCVYCHEAFGKLTADHVVPLSRGGSNDITNIVPACLSCNCSKQDKTPLEYLTTFPAPKRA